MRRKAVEICQDHCRKVLDATRELPLLFTLYKDRKFDELRDIYGRIVRCEEEAAELKRTLMIELTRVGALLHSREDFLRLAVTCTEIADYAGGIAYRMLEMAREGWKARGDILDELSQLAERVLDAVMRLRETVYALSYDASKTDERARGVEDAEADVDRLYRKVELDIVKSGMDFPVVLTLGNIASHLERIADLAEDAADAVRILSLAAF